ncbi:MAG: hypothetical protein HQL75_15355 [Magnetococcales bacterium]|nr:hypothetical protein [Magnetococcales bacterium]
MTEREIIDLYEELEGILESYEAISFVLVDGLPDGEMVTRILRPFNLEFRQLLEKFYKRAYFRRVNKFAVVEVEK